MRPLPGVPSSMSTSDTESCVADWCADEDVCEITCAAAVVGKTRHPVIVHRLLKHGPMGVNRLEKRVVDIASPVLSDSPEDLQDHGVVRREVINDQPFRVEYSLTERRTALEPVVDALETWSRRHLAGASMASSSS